MLIEMTIKDARGIERTVLVPLSYRGAALAHYAALGHEVVDEVAEMADLERENDLAEVRELLPKLRDLADAETERP